MYALADIKRGNKSPVNPITGHKYTQDFLDRMEARYGHTVNINDYPERITEFMVEEKYIYPQLKSEEPKITTKSVKKKQLPACFPAIPQI